MREGNRDECQTCHYFEPKPASRPLGYCHRDPQDAVAQRSDYRCSAFEPRRKHRELSDSETPPGLTSPG